MNKKIFLLIVLSLALGVIVWEIYSMVHPKVVEGVTAGSFNSSQQQ